MRISEATEGLQRIGLSRYEAAVFLNLARLGEASAREIARVSGVNRVQTYRALENLQARGLVEVTLDRPRRYATRAINEVFEMVAEEKRAELDGLEAVRRGLLDAWPKIAMPASDTSSVRLQVLKGRNAIYQALRRFVSEAKREILAFTTAKGLQRSYRAGIHDILLEAIGRGVRPRLLADINGENIALLGRVADRVPVRHVDRQRGRFIIFDRQSILAFLIQDERTIRGEAETAFWTNSRDFVEAHIEFFEQAWESGIPAERRLAALRGS